MSELEPQEQAEAAPAAAAPHMDWFIVHTYSGFEDRVVTELQNRIKALGMEVHFGEIRVPKETVVEMKAGTGYALGCKAARAFGVEAHTI